MNKFFLNLGEQPLANNYLKQYKKNQIKYKLKLFFNTKSKLVSISKKIPSKEMFNNKYPYKSSMSKTMNLSFSRLSNEIKQKFNPQMMLEIGSNDGVLIKHFNKKKIIGIEPCSNLSKITNKMGYKTFSKYWDHNTASFLKKKYKSFDLIYSANTITHIADLQNVFKSISSVLSKDGILIIEDPSLLECLRKNSYDQFYNEHIYVFSALSLKFILDKFNLEFFDIKNLTTHGGSLRYYIKRKSNNKIKIKKSVNLQIMKEKKFKIDKFITYKKFAKNVMTSKFNLLKMLKNLKKNKKKIIGYGATAKATTVLNYCGIDNNSIDFFVDTTPDKINKYMPNKNIKILKYNKSILKNIDYVFLGAWNFSNEILKKEKEFKKKGGKFITHVPVPRLI